MWNAESIYEIPISFFKDNGIEAVIFDLDNTLDPPLTKEASKRTIEKIEELKKNGLFVAIVSNNTKKRIERYVTNLNIDGYVYDARKPSPKKLRSFIEERKLDKNKEAARLEAYSSYSEFIRRTALIEAARIIKENNEGEDTHEHN